MLLLCKNDITYRAAPVYTSMTFDSANRFLNMDTKTRNKNFANMFIQCLEKVRLAMPESMPESPTVESMLLFLNFHQRVWEDVGTANEPKLEYTGPDQPVRIDYNDNFLKTLLRISRGDDLNQDLSLAFASILLHKIFARDFVPEPLGLTDEEKVKLAIVSIYKAQLLRGQFEGSQNTEQEHKDFQMYYDMLPQNSERSNIVRTLIKRPPIP